MNPPVVGHYIHFQIDGKDHIAKIIRLTSNDSILFAQDISSDTRYRFEKTIHLGWALCCDANIVTPNAADVIKEKSSSFFNYIKDKTSEWI